jgi:hypothetical protein
LLGGGEGRGIIGRAIRARDVVGEQRRRGTALVPECVPGTGEVASELSESTLRGGADIGWGMLAQRDLLRREWQRRISARHAGVDVRGGCC